MIQVVSKTFSWWQRVSIRTKLQASIVGFVILVLLVCALFLSLGADAYFHHKTRRDLLMLANVLADNNRAALTFNDAESAFKILGALKENPNIQIAALYKDDRVFSIYPSQDSVGRLAPDKQKMGVWLQGDYYYAAVPVTVADKDIGSLMLVSDLQEWNNMKANLYRLLSILFLGLLVLTVLLSYWLKRVVSNPLARISRWAMDVSRHKSFDSRAAKQSDDEIGKLVDSLNTMLSELAEQEAIVSLNARLKAEVEERKKVEQDLITLRNTAEAANEAKSRFLANMSHEIRTPMNAIIGFVDIMLDTELDQEQRKHLKTVRRSARLLHSLLNDILDVAKLEQGKIQLEKIPFSVRQVLDDVIKTFAIKAQEKNIQLLVNSAADVPENVIGDPLRLSQVLVNLVGNAIKFTEKGAVTVDIAFGADGHLHFAVRDTGIGIPANKLDYIFENFSQADASVSREYGGTGLGTTISRQLVELMGGTICVASEVGVGSTFYFTVNTPPTNRPATPAPATDSAIPETLGRQLMVLVAEDVAENAELLQVRLGGLGHTVVHAQNGKEALSYFDKYQFDIILMDVQMPEMDGLTAAREIRRRPNGGSVPILALTASVLRENRQAAADAGMNGFVTKPVIFSELYREMARVLSLDVRAAEEVAPAVHTEWLPYPLQGVNVKKAMENWRDSHVYIRNLKRFVGSHHDDVNTMETLLEQGQVQKAREVIHALKGVAGNLSLDTLYGALQVLGEHTRKHNTGREGDGAIREPLRDAMREVKEALANLQTLLGELPATALGQPNNEAGLYDREQIGNAITQLDRSLAQGEIAEPQLNQVVHAIRFSGVLNGAAERLTQAVEEFEFEDARGILKQAAVTLNIQSGAGL